ncbi:MAG: hypothetical protein HKN92_05340, partial [Chitinophagales bacterium]|nr:hypothetical protein [Chitinophagales bacterium]
MKSFTLTKAMVMILLSMAFCSLELAAQLEFQVGTSTTSATNYGPIFRVSSTNAQDASRYSHLYSADELAGLDSGSTINKVAWFKTTTAQTLVPASFTVYIENVASSKVALTPGTSWTSNISSATQVFTSSSFQIGDSTGWIMVPITPFLYSGGGLQVSMEWDISTVDPPTDGAFNWRFSLTDTVKTIGKSATTLAGTGTLDVVPASAGGAERPNILFTYAPPPSDNAGVIAITDISASSANGTTPINVVIQNFGGSPLTSATLYALVTDGGGGQTLVGPTAYSGPTLGLGGISDTVNIGSAVLTNNEYTICAWTSMPNGAVDSDFTNDTSCVTTFACNPLSGTFTINDLAPTGGTNFNSFNDAAAILQLCGVGGALTLDVLNGPYNEQVEFGTIPGASATNTITINGNNNIITFGPADNGSNFSVGGNQHIIRLVGTDHFTINNLQIIFDAIDTLAQEVWCVQIVGTSANPADSIAITNCTIIADTAATQITTDDQSNGIVFTGSFTSHFTDGFGNGFLVDNNTIVGGYYGIDRHGPFGKGSGGTVITNNEIYNFGWYGMDLEDLDAPVVSGNTVRDLLQGSSTSTFRYGIYLNDCEQGAIVTKNNVYNIPYAALYMFGVDAGGIFPKSLIANNMLQAGTFADGTINTSTVYALYSSGNDSMNIWFNSTLCVGTSTTAGHGAFISSSSEGTDLRANSFANYGGGVAIEIDAPDEAVAINFNNYYSTGTNTVEYGGSFPNSPAEFWNTQAGLASSSYGPTGHDLSSRFGDPGYVSNTDLHATGAQLNSGTNRNLFAGITDDIDGQARPVLTDIGADEFTPPLNQVAVTSVSGPESNCDISSTSSIILTVQNAGANALLAGDTIPVCYQVDGGAVVSELFILPVSIGPSASLQYTFAATADLSADGVYTITGFAKYDSINDNDTATLTVENQFSFPIPYTEDFETWSTGLFGPAFPNGWSTPETTTPRWQSNSGGTGSGSTGPSGDNTTGSGVYVYLETSGGTTGDEGILISPCLSISGNLPLLSYYYHKYGATMGDLYIEVDNGSGFVAIDSVIGQQQLDELDPWIEDTVDLSAYIGQSIRIQFRGVRGTSFTGDMALDDINIFDALAPEVAVVSIDAPASGNNCGLTSSELITVTVANNAAIPQTNIPISAQVTGTTNIGPAGFTITDTIPAFSTYQYTFPVAIDLSAQGPYQICVWTDNPGDPFAGNDTACINLANYTPPAGPLSTTGDTVGPYNGTPLSGNVSAITAADGIIWYDAPVGGNQLGVGDVLVTPPVSGDTCFYAASFTAVDPDGAICGLGSAQVVVNVFTGSFGNEIAWALYDAGNNLVALSACGYSSNVNVSDTLCVPLGSGYRFEALDNFGDSWNGGTFEILDAVGGVIVNGGTPSGALNINTTISCGSYEIAQIDFFDLGYLCESATRLAACVDVDTVGTDIGVTSIDAPVTQCFNSSSEALTVTLQNFGTDDQTGFNVCYLFTTTDDTGGVVVDSICEVFGGVLAGGSTASFTFATTLDLSNADNTYNINAYTDLALDFDESNNASSTNVNTIGIFAAAPYAETFDSLADNQNGQLSNGWNAQGSGSWGWYSNLGSTGSGSTGPDGDHTSGNGVYMYVETSSQQVGQERSLTSPCIDLGGGQPTMSYWYHAYGANMGDLVLDIQSGGTWILGFDTVFQGQVQTGSSDPYILALTELTAFANQSIQVRFRYISTVAGFTGDGALDDINFFDASLVDIGVETILVDSLGDLCLLDNENIQIQLFNNSGISGSGVPVTLEVSGPIPTVTINETTTNNLPAFGKAIHTFSTAVNLSLPGTYNVRAWTSLGIDVNNSNDTATGVIVSIAAPNPVTATTNDTVLFGASPVSGTVTASAGGSNIVWYDSSEGGSIIGF